MTPTVAVWPAEELAARARLFDALALAFGVSIEAAGAADAPGADALVLFGADPALDARAPRTLAYAAGGPPGAGSPGMIALSASEELDARLRGRTLLEEEPVAAGIPMREGDRLLAGSGAACLWLRRGPRPGALDVAAIAPAELEPGEILRERLRGGRFLALLPLVCLLREIAAQDAYGAPRPRAAFIIDDPNLHRPSYGHVHYDALVRSAREHSYHTVLATVPLDGWLVSERAASLLRESTDVLSLAVHGNDHARRELRIRGPSSLLLCAQALRRTAALERNARMPVCRVMVPPHGVCSADTMDALARLGFEALCGGRSRPPERRAAQSLRRWWPADLSAAGLAVLPRMSLSVARDDLVFRAFLDQPLILYAHHGDLEGGLGELERAAAEIAALGPMSWSSLSGISRMGAATRRDGRALRVRMFSRRAEVDVPEGVDELVVELPPGFEQDGERLSAVSDQSAGGRPEPLRGGTARLPLARRDQPTATTVRLERIDALDPAAVGVPRRRVWPLPRRLLVEGRDRVAPVAARLRNGSQPSC